VVGVKKACIGEHQQGCPVIHYGVCYYDIVVNTNRNGEWNTGEPIDREVGFTAVPEFTTIAIPVAAVPGLVFLMSRRSRHSRIRN